MIGLIGKTGYAVYRTGANGKIIFGMLCREPVDHGKLRVRKMSGEQHDIFEAEVP